MASDTKLQQQRTELVEDLNTEPLTLNFPIKKVGGNF